MAEFTGMSCLSQSLKVSQGENAEWGTVNGMLTEPSK